MCYDLPMADSPNARSGPRGSGAQPQFDPSVFIAHGTVVRGDVAIGAHSSIWYNCVIRGDVHWIRIGERTNIQDGSILHVTHDTHPLLIGDEVTCGHAVRLHGCTIEDRSLIGIGAIVLDGAVVRSGSMVAAGAVVPPGYDVPSGVLVAGVPAKTLRDLTAEEQQNLAVSAANYVEYARLAAEETRDR